MYITYGCMVYIYTAYTCTHIIQIYTLCEYVCVYISIYIHMHAGTIHIYMDTGASKRGRGERG